MEYKELKDLSEEMEIKDLSEEKDELSYQDEERKSKVSNGKKDKAALIKRIEELETNQKILFQKITRLAKKVSYK